MLTTEIISRIWLKKIWAFDICNVISFLFLRIKAPQIERIAHAQTR